MKKSYKGLLESIWFVEISRNAYEDKVRGFAFEKYKVELMYQF